MVRVRYSFSSRRTRHIENIRKQREEFPEIVRQLINSSDIILEILDARFIDETRDKELEELIKKRGKKIIFVLNKSDLIDKDNLNREKLKEMYPYVFVSSKTRKGVKDLRSRIKIESKKIEKTENTLGKVTVGVIGYPNTGKSSVINTLIGKHSAGTASEAGYTKGIQKLKLGPDIFLIDSPGIIPARKYSQVDEEKIAKHAKVGGRSYSQVKDPAFVIANIMKEYKNLLEKHYNIEANGDSEILMEKLGKKRGFLIKGGEVDTDKTARFILKDWQMGNIRA